LKLNIAGYLENIYLKKRNLAKLETRVREMREELVLLEAKTMKQLESQDEKV